MKLGDTELEYEGPVNSVESKYEDAVSRLSAVPFGKKLKAGEADTSGRGGVRSNVIAKVVDSLMSERWLEKRRPRNAIVEELRNRRIPGVDNNNVTVALDRRVRAGRLKSIKDNGDWVYWQE